MDLSGMQVAVVGGAVGGASTALLLARAGASVTLFERVPVFTAVGAGIALQPNGLAVLYGLGLERPLRARGRLLDGSRVADPSGRTLFTVPLGGSELGHALMLRRSELHELLLEALEHEPGIRLHLGAEVRGASPDGTLEVEGEQRRFHLVVGADGVRSRVREGGAFGAQVTRTGIHYLRGLASVEAARNEEAWTAAGIFGSFLVSGGTYWYCSMGTSALRAAVEARDVEALRRVWREAYPAATPLLEQVRSFDEVLVNEVIRVDCARFDAGRLVLVGDAAHAMSPNLGQGANSALVDAAVLLDELQAAESLEEALARYDRRRRPAVRWVQDTAQSIARLSERTGRSFRWFRDRVLMPLAAVGGSGRVTRTFQEPPERLLHVAASVAAGASSGEGSGSRADG